MIRVIRWLYTELYGLLLPFILIRLKWRSGHDPAVGKRLLERFGDYKQMPKPVPGGIWIHAVSVGEFLGILPFILQLKKIKPDLPITVTTTTATGSAAVQKQLGDSVFHVYVPYDIPYMVKRFLRFVEPKLAIFMETEVWPNILANCEQMQIKTLLINARMSARSQRGYARFAGLTRPMFASLTQVMAQYQEDADRLMALGVSPERITVTGSLKFDVLLPDDLSVQAEALKQQWHDREVLIVASTHPGEEETFLAIWQALKVAVPNLLLVLVPRHPNRRAAIMDMYTAAGLTVLLRTQNKRVTPDIDVLMVDTLGELLYFYGASDVAFVGGSLVSHGGHNVLEPAVMSLPIVVGQYTFNFAEITRILRASGGLFVVEDSQQLIAILISLLQNKALREDAGQKALQCAKRHQGVLDKVVRLVKPFLENLA